MRDANDEEFGSREDRFFCLRLNPVTVIDLYGTTFERSITMRRRTILFSLVAACVLFAASPFAAADIIQDLTVKIDFQTCNNQLCMFDEGFDGAPASGYASFAQLGLPWTYSFVTPPPYWWCDSEQPDCGGFWYQALFGQGGSFTMTGPDGLTFNGIVTSGWTFHPGPGDDEITIDFSGQWSNGLSASGEAYEYWWSDQFYDVEAKLYTSPSTPVPEPGSLVLLASGVLGLVSVLRRELIR